MAQAVLTLNAGSSSVKFALFGLQEGGDLMRLLVGQVESAGEGHHFEAKGNRGEVFADDRWEGQSFDAILRRLIDWIEAHLGDLSLSGIGHRVVHGGASHYKPELVTESLLSELDVLAELAPLHVPHNVAPIRALAASRGDLPQVACFDTAFHHTIPAVATRLGLPRKYEQEGIRRYGFHGLSYENVAETLQKQAPLLAMGRVLAAHLGNGASLCAIKDGQSVETSMGFTALEGLVMGTRCGSIDPGAVLHIMKHDHLDAAAMETVLYKKSGLLGVSGGLSNDMRTLLASDSQAAREAVELFCYRIIREGGALVSAMGGLDGLVFTGGIGEHAAKIRADVANGLSWLGVKLDDEANEAGLEVISAPESRVEVRVIKADEEAVIANHTRDVLAGLRK